MASTPPIPPRGGAELRTDIIDVYVFRRTPPPAGGAPASAPAGHAARGFELLQLRRSSGALSGTWQPVMGHARPDETAARTAARELEEETGLLATRDLLGLWQLETPNIYFLASHNAMVLAPCFAAEVDPGAAIRLNDEHDRCRWVARDHADRCFLWPGQRQAVAQIARDLVAPDRSCDAHAGDWLRIDPAMLQHDPG